ncbi:polysaccharide deacetylase family protein [Alicyclobacillus fodiniaquatilis]|uniref:Polysaccharide deacetylase family protein n=1 Tax=Alicyclobacillus fodiniaquatilis TaxID=1661150 RepID=A0ABW4JPY4_9BACL
MDVKEKRDGSGEYASDFIIRRVLTNEKWLALTFDDGPNDHYAQAILNILARYEVPAAFFCIGTHVQQHPDVLRQMVDAGHVVANHSWNHPHLTKVTQDELISQLESTSASIAEVIHKRPRLFRPPYGDLDSRVIEQTHSLGYDIVLWDVDSVDWSGIPGERIAANVLPNIRSGSIVLQHCDGPVAGTIDALSYIIEVAVAMGYRFVGLEELMGVSAYA